VRYFKPYLKWMVKILFLAFIVGRIMVNDMPRL